MYNLRVKFNCEDCSTEHVIPVIAEEEPELLDLIDGYYCDRCNGKLLVTEVLDKKRMK
jgi:DNA-directed RNA polymerase subunit RPC12/RpoP